MNIKECDVLKILSQFPFTNQRILSQECGYSLGTVNIILKSLAKQGYLDEDYCLTEKAQKEILETSPRNAIILAAGFGMRMVPINMETSKGLLEVNGETLIERIIKQLHEVGIDNIYVVVGFMKERYEYLMDTYGIKLVVNSEYASKNNLHSLKRAVQNLSNTYVIPCDIWCRKNPFSNCELYSWYLVSNEMDKESCVRVNKKRELRTVKEDIPGNRMIGICYLAEPQAGIVRERILKLSKDDKYNNAFWEETLYDYGHVIVAAKVINSNEVVEINTYEQLRELDAASAQLQTEAISAIAKAMDIAACEITNIEVLKKGMTNRSFLFSARDQQYIMRIPGEGTDQLIDRAKEAAVYSQIEGREICDDIFYLNPQNGYKITRYFKGARTCDPLSESDLCQCMKKLQDFHNLGLKVDHVFDIFEQIEFYESLWQGNESVYGDYQRTKEHVLSLKEYIDQHKSPYVLTHIDAIPDNFLFIKDPFGREHIRLIDWEYAGMQDPHVDIAMFCIYSLYGREQVDHLIDIYFDNACTQETRVKIYCYIACCGLLWSNWCEYKRQLGVEFGEYSLRQYRYAKDYFRIVQNEWKRMEGTPDA